MAKLAQRIVTWAVVPSALFVLIAIFETDMALADSDKVVVPYREINITSDSAPGWIPSTEQEQAAQATAEAYLAAKDAGNAEAAYQYFTDINKQYVPFEIYKAGLLQFNTQAGSVIEHRIIKITWTKDSPNAPLPGIYAALDLVSRYINVDRDCGYLVLYQPSAGGNFRIMREESNFMDNPTAASIEQKHSKVEVDHIWAQLSANCPNYEGSPEKSQ